MKILIASHGYPPNQSAGAEWQAYRTAVWLKGRGHTVQVLAVDDTLSPQVGPRLARDEVDGVRVWRYSYYLDQGLGERNEYENPFTQPLVEKLLAESEAELLHLYCGLRLTLTAVSGARAGNVPVVITPTDYWLVCPRILLRRRTGELCAVPDDPAECAICILNEQRRFRLPHRLTRGLASAALKRAGLPALRALADSIGARRAFMRAQAGQARRVIAQSRFLADLLARHVTDPKSIVVTRQGTSLAGLARPAAYTPGSPLTFGYIGQIAEHKGLSVLVQAFRQLPGTAAARLVIYGSPAKAWPPYWERLQREIGADSRITVAGAFSNLEAQEVYQSLDALVMPSVWYENSPNVILEAFACGVPVLAANLGGMAELVTHNRNGYLFEANNVASLRAGLQTVVDQPGLLNEWRIHIPHVRSVDDEMLELEGVYRAVIAEAQADR